MVDNNVAYGRDNRAGSFSDGDPLAELARIVGYDEKPGHVAPANVAPVKERAVAPVSAPVRREPEFNLEEELLREFDRYDGPAPSVAPDAPSRPAYQTGAAAPAILQSVAERAMSPVARPPVAEQHEIRREPPAPVFEDVEPYDDGADFGELGVDLASELEQAMDMAPQAPLRSEPVVAFTARPEPVMRTEPEAEMPRQKLSPMEELLYDVDRYELTSARNGGSAQSLPLPVDQQQSRVEVPRQPVEEIPVPAPAPVAPVRQSRSTNYPVLNQVAPVRTVAPPPVAVAAPVAPVAAAPLQNDFDDGGFELALEDIDLDLSDIDDAGNEEVTAAPAAASGLYFDPGQIGETDEVPETISDVDVPSLPPHEPEVRTARKSEDDFDLDSELAVLFNPGKPQAGISRSARGPAPGAAAPVESGVDDDFERALEEDFRRSLKTSMANDTGAQQPMPPLHPADVYEDAGGRRPRWIWPAAAAFVAVAAGGVYALVGTGGMTSSTSSGEPVVIAAEKGPLKVVPENPGGKTVPNQDKAVYDRVAGGEPARPGQESLISTNEQPVDVVQHTLSPENFPLPADGEDELVAGTPAGETEDERLLSQGERAAVAADESSAGVAPRKVRTMIVKPDGTLVAQEEPEAPATVASTPPRDNGAISGLAPPSGEAAPQVTAATPAASGATATSNVQVASVPPASNVAPVPSLRPSDQPANVVATVTSQGNVTNGAPPESAAQQATSAASAGGYYIQIASLPSEAEAQRSYQSLSGRYSSVIGGRGVDIKRADIAGKGTYFRVRIPAGDKSAAATLCERYRAAGGNCIVAR